MNGLSLRAWVRAVLAIGVVAALGVVAVTVGLLHERRAERRRKLGDRSHMITESFPMPELIRPGYPSPPPSPGWVGSPRVPGPLPPELEDLAREIRRLAHADEWVSPACIELDAARRALL